MYQLLWLKLKLFITTRSRAVRWTTVVLLGIFVIFGLGAFIHPAHAAGVVDCLGAPIDCAGNVISTFLLWIATIIGKILVVLIDILLGIIQYNDFVRSAAVSKGWVVIRDLCNMFFVAVLLIIAFGTILRIESYKYQRLLPQLIIMAVLINFSKLIAGFLIDVSQVVLLTFANAFKDSAAGNFTNIFQMKSMLDFVDPLHPDTTLGFWQKIGVSLFAIILLVVATFVMLAMIVVFLARIVYLWILVVLSPLAYLLAVVPMGKQYASRWWSTFGKWVTTGPILAFFIWLALSVLSTGTGGSPAAVINLSGSQGEAVNAGLTNAGLSAGLGTNSSSENMLGFMLAVAMLVMAMGFAQALGGFAGKWTGNMMGRLQKTGSLGLKMAGAPLAGLGSLAKSQGRRARRWYEDKTPAIMQPWNLVKGAKERGEELDKMSRSVAQAKGREAWEKFTTGGKIKLPHVDKVESGIESQFARDYAVMDKEEKAESYRLLWERHQKNPGNMETKRRMRGLLRVAAEGGHLDDIMTDQYFADKAEWVDEDGETRHGFRDKETGEKYTRPMLNRFLKASFGDDQQGMRLAAEIEDIGKRAKHEEYGGHVQYNSKDGEYEWKGPNDIGRAVSESSKVSSRTGMGNAPMEFVGLRDQKVLVGDQEGLIMNDGKAIFGGKTTKFSEKSYNDQRPRIDRLIKQRLAKMGKDNEKNADGTYVQNADGTYDFTDLTPEMRQSGGNMDEFNDAQFIHKFGDQPTTRINEHAQIRTAEYMLGGGRQNINEEGAIVGDDVDKKRIQNMMDQWIQAPMAFWKKIGADGILKFQKIDMGTGEKVGDKEDIFDLIKADAKKRGDVTKDARGNDVYSTTTQDHLKDAYNFYSDPKNGALSAKEYERLDAVAAEFKWEKEEKKRKGKREEEAREEEESEEEGKALADVDRQGYENTKAQFNKQGNAFFVSEEYQKGLAGGRYVERDRFDEARALEEYKAQHGTEGLRGVATYGSNDSHNVLGFDFKNLDVEGVDLKTKAGEYITDPKVLDKIKPKILEMIDKEMGTLQAKPLGERSWGDQQRLNALQAAKNKVNDEDSFKKLKLANIGRTGFDMRHVLAHENTHEQLDEIDPDGKLQKEIWNNMSNQARNIASAQVKSKMNNQKMSEAQVMSEYFTEGLANAGPANRADQSKSAITLPPSALQRLAEKVKVSAPLEEKIVVPQAGARAPSVESKSEKMIKDIQSLDDRGKLRLYRDQMERDLSTRRGAYTQDDFARIKEWLIQNAKVAVKGGDPSVGKYAGSVASVLGDGRKEILHDVLGQMGVTGKSTDEVLTINFSDMMKKYFETDVKEAIPGYTAQFSDRGTEAPAPTRSAAEAFAPAVSPPPSSAPAQKPAPTPTPSAPAPSSSVQAAKVEPEKGKTAEKPQDANIKFGTILNNFVKQFRDGDIPQMFKQFSHSKPSSAEYESAAKQMRSLFSEYMKDKRVPSDKIPEFKVKLSELAGQLKPEAAAPQTAQPTVQTKIDDLAGQAVSPDASASEKRAAEAAAAVEVTRVAPPDEVVNNSETQKAVQDVKTKNEDVKNSLDNSELLRESMNAMAETLTTLNNTITQQLEEQKKGGPTKDIGQFKEMLEDMINKARGGATGQFGSSPADMQKFVWNIDQIRKILEKGQNPNSASRQRNAGTDSGTTPPTGV